MSDGARVSEGVRVSDGERSGIVFFDGIWVLVL